MREIWTQGDGVRLFAIDQGAGPVVVLLHGGMADHHAVLPMTAALAARSRVITPDLRGSGRSWYGGPLTFDRLADDVESWLDYLGVPRAVIGGVSGGAGVALRFALLHRSRTSALVLVKPVHAGADRGSTAQQQATFAMMDGVASQVRTRGIQALRPLYANLPAGTREKALAMIERWDPESVVATSRFLASGAQPFANADDLKSVDVPTLLVRGDDPLHPREVSDLYAGAIAGCAVLAATTDDVPAAIGAFLDRTAGTGA